MPENPTAYGGRGECNFGLQALRNYSKAYRYWDANEYRYPTFYEEAYKKYGARYDSYRGKASDADGYVAILDDIFRVVVVQK